MIDEGEIRKWWDCVKFRGLTEVRILSAGRTYGGYFNDVETLYRSILPYAESEAQLYFTLNHVKSACYSRCASEIKLQNGKSHLTSDGDIDGREWVLVDLDAERPSGVGSTDEELKFAHDKCGEIYKFLLSEGFSPPLVAMSGNGYHLLIRCRIENNAKTTELVKSFLKSLDLMFSDSRVHVDTSVYNASRICKLYGTMVKKGSNTPDRPWRMSRIVYIPSRIEPVDIAYFRKVSEMVAMEDPTPSHQNGYRREAFDLEGFMRQHGISYRTEHISGGTKYILDHCPFDHSHVGKDSMIFQRDNGAIGFHCFHNSCSGKTWRDVRLLYDPNAYCYQYRPSPMPSGLMRPNRLPPILETPEKGQVWLKPSDIRREPFNLADYIPSGILGIDKRGFGFKRGMVSVWSGKRGCGKSSLLNMLILNSAQRGYKSALWTGELTPDLWKQWLILQAAGKRFNMRWGDSDFYYTRKDVVEDIDRWLDGYVRIFNNKYGNSYENLESQIRRIVGDSKIDSVFLDNLMVMDYRLLDDDKYDSQSRLMDRLSSLSKELNIHIHLVVHPHKNLGYVRVDNISGTGNIANMADNIFLLSRTDRDFDRGGREFFSDYLIDDIMSSNCSNILEIAKFRARGTLVGNLVRLWFEPESNRLKNEMAEYVHYAWETPSLSVSTPSPADSPDAQSSLPFEEESQLCPF